MARRLKRLAKSPLGVLAIGLLILPVVLLANTTYNALNTPITLDNNGNILVSAAAVGGGTPSTTNFANSRLTLDSSGNLLVALNGGTATPNSLCLDAANKDACLIRAAANTLAQRNGSNAQTFQIGVATNFLSLTGAANGTATAFTAGDFSLGLGTNGAARIAIDDSGGSQGGGASYAFYPIVTGTSALGSTAHRFGSIFGGAAALATTDATITDSGDITRQRFQATITPASGGAGNCGAAFLAAALTADCTIATLPAGAKLVGVYADVTAGFTCSGTCTGTKTIMAGKTAGGSEILTTGLSVVTTGTRFGLVDTDLGTAMVRAAAVQGGYLNSWTTTTPVIVRFTSGTGNWGSGAATFVNAGSVTFTLITEQVK